MPGLTVRLKKGSDGPHSLACIREDGTKTHQHQRNEFFPLHDLTHYAVESVLGYQRGFFGLVASGWDLADFGSPWPRGKLPADLDPSELIVAALDRERGTGEIATAEEINGSIASWFAENAPAAPLPAPITEAELARIRERRADLHARWRALRPGGSLEVMFPE
jgi:hypothetical protein